MIAALRRRLNRQRRDRARRPLITLVRYSAYRAMAPMAGRAVTDDLLMQCERAVEAGLRSLADGGAFLYFGIRDATELGAVPVALAVDGEGRVEVVVEPLVQWIFSGAAGPGWRSPDQLTAADLELE